MSCLPYAGTNRIRFQGCDLRPLRPPLGSLLRSQCAADGTGSQGRWSVVRGLVKQF